MKKKKINSVINRPDSNTGSMSKETRDKLSSKILGFHHICAFCSKEFPYELQRINTQDEPLFMTYNCCNDCWEYAEGVYWKNVERVSLMKTSAFWRMMFYGHACFGENQQRDFEKIKDTREQYLNLQHQFNTMINDRNRPNYNPKLNHK